MAHELHFIDASNAVAKNQLRNRSEHMRRGSPWTTEAKFEAMTLYFHPPSDDEDFNVVHHERA